METMPCKPLDGFRVIDVTNVLAGPFCGNLLAHMGADVIKVEAPGHGDLARQLGSDFALNRRLMGISFLAQNAGKRSLVLDMKSAEGKEALKKLVRRSDALIENFRPGVMDRLGVGYGVLKQENPKLVYCAISGFGQQGPMRDHPAFDQIIQGISGVMSITGAPENAPYRVGYPVADTIGGLTAAFAVSSALAGRTRAGGCFLDVSMLDATISTMGWVVANFLNAGKVPAPMGNENVTASPSGTFRTGDGLLNIAANKQEQYESLCRAVGREDLIADPRFRERQTRLEMRFELKAELELALAKKSAQKWSELLNKVDVPAGCVLTVPEALNLPQVVEREVIETFMNVPGVERDVRVVRPGVRINGKALSVTLPPPLLGQHSQEILDEFGLHIAAADRDGAVKAAS